MDQRFVMSPLLFSITIDVIKENSRKNSIPIILYANGKALSSDIMSNLSEKSFI